MPGKSKKSDTLTPKERKFVNAYLQSGNATEAAREAGYTGTDESLASIGWRVLRKVKIRDHVNARMAEADVQANEVIGTLVSQMRGDITELFEDDGGFISQIGKRGLGHLIKSITVKRSLEKLVAEDGTTKFAPVETVRLELHSAQAAAVQLCKVLGIERQPAPNREQLEIAIQQFLTRTKRPDGEPYTREEAIEYLKPYIPQISQLVH